MPARSPFMRIAIGGAVPKGPRWAGAPEAGPAPGGRSEGRQPVRFLNRKGKKWPSVNRDMERLMLQFCCGFDDMWGLYLLSMMLIVQSWLFNCLLLVLVFVLLLFLLFCSLAWGTASHSRAVTEQQHRPQQDVAGRRIFLPRKHQHNWNISRPTVCYQDNIKINYNISGDQWWSTSLRVSKLIAVVMKSFSASSMTSTQLITILPTFFVTNLTNCPCYHPRCMLRAAVGVRSSIVQQVVDRSGRLDPIWYSDIMLYQSLYSIS